MQEGAIITSSLDRIRQLHGEFGTLILSAAERKWEIGKLLSELRDRPELEDHWQFWVETNLPFKERWERECRAFYRQYSAGAPTDSQQLTLKEARDDSPIEGNVTLSPAPSYLKVENTASLLWSKWKSNGCPYPHVMLASIESAKQVLDKQLAEVRQLMELPAMEG